MACQLGRTDEGVKHQTRRLGLSKPSSRPWSEGDEDILRETYASNTPIEEIAVTVDRTVLSTKLRAQRLGLRRKELLFIHRDYFKIIRSNLQAYHLGLLAADGFVSNRDHHYSIALQLQARDVAVIERFRDEIAPESPIVKHPNAFRVTIASKELVQDLVQFGIVPCKFAQLEWPELLPEEYDAPFLLGYFDGDGSLFRSVRGQKTYWIWSLVGTEQLLLRVKEKIMKITGISVHGPMRNCKDKSPHLYALRLSRQDDIRKLDSALNLDNLGLPRKHFSID